MQSQFYYHKKFYFYFLNLIYRYTIYNKKMLQPNLTMGVIMMVGGILDLFGFFERLKFKTLSIFNNY